MNVTSGGPTPPTPESGPLCFTAQQDGSSVGLIGWDDFAYEQIDIFVSLQYSTDGNTWQEWDGHVIHLNNGEKVYVKALNPNSNGMKYYDEGLGYVTKYHKFIFEGKIAASGNIQYLLEDTGSRTDVPRYAYYCLFAGIEDQETYQWTSVLTQAPELPATTLADNCYSGMFSGCTSLVQAPELPATTLADYCYASMFQYCTSLAQAPAIKTYESSISAFNSMLAELDPSEGAWGQLTTCNWPDLTLSDVENMVLSEPIFGWNDPGEDTRINITCKDGSGVAYFDQDNWSWIFEY